jgi:multicomponent Na+:H+ antiporter subunit C
LILFSATILFLIGLYAVMVKKDLVKILLGIILIEFSAEIYLVLLGEKMGSTVLIEMAVAILLIAIVARIYDRFETMDVTRIRELKG